jgi:hypothetical protein
MTALVSKHEMGQFFYFVSSLFPYRSTENRATRRLYSSSRNRRTIYLFVDGDCEGLQISYFLGKLVKNKMH